MAVTLPKAPRILIARGDVLGDTVLSTVVIDPIKKAYPDASIHFMVQKPHIDLLSDVKEIDGFIEDPFEYESDFKEEKHRLKQLAEELKAKKFDVYISLWEQPRYAWLGWYAGIKIRAGHDFGFWNWLFYTHKSKLDRREFIRHQADQNLSLLSVLGLNTTPESAPIRLSPNTEKLEKLKKAYPFLNEPFCLIDINSKNTQKLMILQNYQAIISYLLTVKKQRVVMMTSKPESIQRAVKLQKVLNHPNLYQVGGMSLSELVTLTSAADFFIGPDSGPIHIAAGVKCPAIVYYLNRIQSALNWGPWQSPHYVIRSHHTCTDICESTVCKKLDCRVPVHLKQFYAAIDALVSGEKSHHSDQRNYWLKKSSHIAVSDSKLAQELRSEGWHIFEFSETSSIKEIKTVLSNKNISFILNSSQNPWVRLKLEIARTWASNEICYYAKIMRVRSLDVFSRKMKDYSDHKVMPY